MKLEMWDILIPTVEKFTSAKILCYYKNMHVSMMRIL
jgi:hypothetical protein